MIDLILFLGTFAVALWLCLVVVAMLVAGFIILRFFPRIIQAIKDTFDELKTS